MPGEWKLVPCDPTAKMTLAGLAEGGMDATFCLAVNAVYRAMLSASPVPEKEGADANENPTATGAGFEAACHEEALRIVARLEQQIPCTRAYLVDNRIDPHFADVLLSHYGDFARELRAALSASTDTGATPESASTDWRCRSCGSAFKSAGGKIVGGTCPNGRPTCPLEPDDIDWFGEWVVAAMERITLTEQLAALSNQEERRKPEAGAEPIPPGIYWCSDFYRVDGVQMPAAFFDKWVDRAREFPKSPADATPSPSQTPPELREAVAE